MEVTNILEAKEYELAAEEEVPVIKNWLCRDGLQLIKTFKNEKEKCKTQEGIFSVLGYKFKLHHNRMVLSLQNLKLKRKAINLSQSGWADYKDSRL